ncbi:MAG: hypothetical protein K2X47_03800 [Bdellovibrionales bacterium]|nr:hypothetical protein [Bdellovibrionales bacterium]
MNFSPPKSRRRRVHVLSLALVMIGALSGCAYRMGQGERKIPGGYELISVPLFKNQTGEVGAEVYFTNAMIEQVERNGMAKVRPRDSAQAVIEGAVTSINFVQGGQVELEKSAKELLKTNRYVPGEQIGMASEYRAVVGIEMRLKRISDGTVLWSGTYTGERRFSAPQVFQSQLNSINATYNQSGRHQTLELLSKALMAEAYESMVENF